MEYFLERLRFFREFYTHVGVVVDTDDFITFQTFLDVFGTWNNETFFDTRRIMKMVRIARIENILNLVSIFHS